MTFSRWLLVLAVVDAAIGIGILLAGAGRGRDERRVSVVELSMAMLVAVVVGALQAAVLLGDGFARLHLAYLVIVVTLPLIGGATTWVWFRARRSGGSEVTGAAAVLAAGLIGLAAVGVWATHVEPFRLRTDRATLDVAQIGEDDEPIRVGVLADLQTTHIGEHEWNAVRRLNRERPDVVVLPGDFIQGTEATSVAENAGLQRLLGAFEAPGGVFLVAGDADSPERLTRIVADTDLVGLDNDVATTVVRGRRIWIGGLENDYRSPEAETTIAALDAAGDDGDLRILVSHRPDAALLLGDDSSIDLVVAGHTHGGQVALPFFGPPVILSDVPRSIGAGGLHDLDGQAIYVGTGVGLERWTAPQVRLFARPSVGGVDLR